MAQVLERVDEALAVAGLPTITRVGFVGANHDMTRSWVMPLCGFEEHQRTVRPTAHWLNLFGVLGGGPLFMVALIALLGGSA